MKICKVKGCSNKHLAKGYCSKHYYQLRKYGKIFERTRFDKNKIIEHKRYYELCLYSGLGKQKEVARTKIDKDDLNKIKNYKWCLNDSRYVTTKINNRKISLHRLIMSTPKGFDTDHKNHDILDNRKKNLRVVTHSQNLMNRKSSGYSFDKHRNKWRARIMVDYKEIWLGYFSKREYAIQARKNAEQKYFGKFAYKLITV